MSFLKKVYTTKRVLASDGSDLNRFFDGATPPKDGEAEGHHNEKGLSLTQAIDSFMFHMNGKAVPKITEATVSYADTQKIGDEEMKDFARKVWKYGVQLRRKYDQSATSEEGES